MLGEGHEGKHAEKREGRKREVPFFRITQTGLTYNPVSVAFKLLHQVQGFWEGKVQYLKKGLVIPPISLASLTMNLPS